MSMWHAGLVNVWILCFPPSDLIEIDEQVLNKDIDGEGCQDKF